MRNIFFITTFLLLNKAFSQSPTLNFNIDSLNIEIVDTLIRTTSDYKFFIFSNVDYPSNRKVLVIGITDNDSNTTSKRYDWETKAHLETRTVKQINGKVYHNGPFYVNSLDGNFTSYGTYKMNYLEGLVISKDSTGQIISKSFCNSKKKECKEEEYYSNGNIKRKYQTIASVKYFGEYIEYNISGSVKIKGKYTSYKITPKNRNDYFKKIQNYEEIGISENDGYVSVKTGIWEYYNEDGSLIKKEKYDNYGKLLE